MVGQISSMVRASLGLKKPHIKGNTSVLMQKDLTMISYYCCCLGLGLWIFLGHFKVLMGEVGWLGLSPIWQGRYHLSASQGLQKREVLTLRLLPYNIELGLRIRCMEGRS